MARLNVSARKEEEKEWWPPVVGEEEEEGDMRVEVKRVDVCLVRLEVRSGS